MERLVSFTQDFGYTRYKSYLEPGLEILPDPRRGPKVGRRGMSEIRLYFANELLCLRPCVAICINDDEEN